MNAVMVFLRGVLRAITTSGWARGWTSETVMDTMNIIPRVCSSTDWSWVILLTPNPTATLTISSMKCVTTDQVRARVMSHVRLRVTRTPSEWTTPGVQKLN